MKKRNLVLGVILTMTLPFFSCSHGVKIVPKETVTEKAGIISVQVDSIKDKKKKFDLHVTITNESDAPILFLLTDLHCFRGGREGVLKPGTFNTGERAVDFAAHQAKVANVICDLTDKVTGEFKLSIAKVFDNPSGDHRTTGKAIASDVEWKSADTK